MSPKKISITVKMYLHRVKETESMKAFHFLLVLSVLMSISLVIIPGCKYNITTPLWDRPYKTPLTPSITSVDPASEAKPGVNVITIHGHNFIVTASDTLTPDTTIVYFNAFQANVVSIDSTTIIVRRPNLSGDSITIKVSSHNAIVEPSVGPYKVDPVSETSLTVLDFVFLSR